MMRNLVDPRTQARLELARYLDLFPAEAASLDVLARQLENVEADVFSRQNLGGHVTTSAIILDLSATRALLVHNRLDNRWLQPGGHYEGGELWASAMREAVGVTGLRSPRLHDWSVSEGCPVDIDSHVAAVRPARGEQAHLHHDFAYLLTADYRLPLAAQLEEVLDARWVSLAVVEELGDIRLCRIVDKLAALGISRRPRLS